MEPIYVYREPLEGEHANDLWLIVRRGLRSPGERYKQWYLQEIARVLELDYSLELGIDWEKEFPSQGHY